MIRASRGCDHVRRFIYNIGRVVSGNFDQLGVACQTRGEIANTRVPPAAPAQPDAAVITLLEHGSNYLQEDDYDMAIASFDKAIELDPQFAFSYASRGIAYYYKN